jgi:hypothetical protein
MDHFVDHGLPPDEFAVAILSGGKVMILSRIRPGRIPLHHTNSVDSHDE